MKSEIRYLGKCKLNGRMSNWEIFIHLKKYPLVKRNMDSVSDYLNLPIGVRAEILETSLSTYNHWLATTTLGINKSELVIHLASVVEIGLQAFDDDIKKLNHWINIPIDGLGHYKPLEFLGSWAGIDIVKQELLRIEHSVY